MTDPVVVGVDGSASSWRALDWAVADAAVHDRPLLVVHAFGFPLAFLGSGAAADTAAPVSHHCVQHGHCPVVVVREE